MERVLVVMIGSVLVAACSSPITSPSATTTPFSSSDAADVSRYFAIEEIGLGPDGYVTLLNYTDVPASLDTVYLCQERGCVGLPDFVVRGGEVARIGVGDGASLEAVAITGAALDLPPSDGEVAIYASEDVRDIGSIRAYLEWGSTPHELTEVAVEAGLWFDGSFAPTAPNATRLFRNEGGLWVFETQ